MNTLRNNPVATIIGLVVVVILAVFVWLYATDPDRQPASAQSAATAPAASAPSAVAPSSSGTDTGDDSDDVELGATPSPTSTANQSNSALSKHAPEAGDWREPAEAFAAAYSDTHGGDQKAWLAGMEPYVTEDLHENFTYTHIANVVDAEVESVESVQIESTTMTFKIHTAAGDDQTIALMELQPSGEWLVSAVGLTSTDLE